MGEDNFDMNMFDENDELFLEDIPVEGEEQDNDPSDNDEQNNLGEDVIPEGVAENEANDEGESSDTSPNIYNSFATVLYEQGLLPSFADKLNSIKDIDSLANAFKEEIKSNEYKDLSTDQKEFLDSLRGGITKEHFLAYKETEQILNSISEDALINDEELRKNIIYQEAINSGINENKASKLVELSIANGTDIEDAKSALDSLKVFEKEKLERLKQENATKAKQLAINTEKSNKQVQELIEKKDLFEGLKINDGLRQSAFKSMNTIVGVDKEGNPQNKLMKYRSENPEEYNAKLYLLYELTNGFKDLTKIKTSTSSQKIKDFEDTLRRSNFIDKGGQPGYLMDTDSYLNIGDELILE